ncbi:MAG: DMT family transporter [Paracoccaceae bacterium]
MPIYLKGLLITLFGVLTIAPDTLLIRLIDADHWAQAFWRSILSGSTVLVFVIVVARGRVLAPFRGFGWAAVALTLGFGLGNLLFVYSVTHTLVANTLFILATMPVFAALIARFVLGETVGARTWITIAVTLGGIGVIAFGSARGAGGGSLAGDLAALGVAVLMATNFSIARVKRARSAVPFLALGTLLSGAVAWGVAGGAVTLPRQDWIWMGLMGLWVVPVAFICISTGPRYLPAADVSLLMLLEAVFGPLLVWAVLGEWPGGWTLAGGAIVLGALAVSNLVLLAGSGRARRAAI